MTFSLLAMAIFFVTELSKSHAESSIFFDGAFSSKSWSQSSAHVVDSDEMVSFIVALKIRNVEGMKATLLSVSDPTSESYGKYLSIKQILDNYGPLPQIRKDVINFFKTIKGANIESNKHEDMIIVTAKVHQIETVLQTELAVYLHETSSEAHVIRTVKPLVLPADISSHISFVSLNSPVVGIRGSSVTQTINLEETERNEKTNNNKSQESARQEEGFVGATPAAIRSRYSIPLSETRKQGYQAVGQFYSENWSNEDLKRFLHAANQNTSYYVHKSEQFGDRENDENNPSGEASLDVQYIMAIAPGVKTAVYTMSDLNPYSSNNEGFLKFMYIIGNQTTPPLVHSLSYGDMESEIYDENNPGSYTYGDRVEVEFMKAGLRGLTLCFASGDWGIGNWSGKQSRCDQAIPDWPASSPYVTAVGGTQPYHGQEVVCSSHIGGVITSGGGFSWVYDMGPWQKSVVEKYLEQTDKIPELSHFNSLGRAYPDVAALAYDYPVYIRGRVQHLFGTSASAPVFAAIVSLLNHERLKRNMPQLGFINPFLYWAFSQDESAFIDITQGDNACGTYQACCSQFFSASVGWDAVSGLGAINYPKLLNLALKYHGNVTYTNTPTPQPSSDPTKHPSQQPATIIPTPIPVTQAPSTRNPAATFKPTSSPSARPSSKPNKKYSKSNSWFNKMIGGS